MRTLTMMHGNACMGLSPSTLLRCAMRLLLAMLILPIAMIQSCGLFQRSEKRTEDLNTEVQEDSASKVSKKKDLKREITGVLLHQDSSSTDYSVLIYPKGSFSFSADGSFKGEAERIKISGKTKDFGASASALQLNEEDRGTLDATAINSKKSVASLRSAVSTSSWWSWRLTALVALLLVALCCTAKWWPLKKSVF